MAHCAHVSNRPAALTALAVLNFVVAVPSGISYASFLRMLGERGAVTSPHAAEPAAGLVYALLAAGLASSILLAIAGVGYLRGHRLWGRALGNLYALLAFATSVVVLAALPQGFGFGTVSGLLYAPLTVALVNLRFRSALA